MVELLYLETCCTFVSNFLLHVGIYETSYILLDYTTCEFDINVYTCISFICHNYYDDTLHVLHRFENQFLDLKHQGTN